MIDKIKIGDKIYPVIEDDELHYRNDIQAQIRYRDVKILIMPNQEPQYQIECLVHEAVHGMLVFMGEDDKDNEQSVRRISCGLLMLIRDNPELFAGYAKKQSQ